MTSEQAAVAAVWIAGVQTVVNALGLIFLIIYVLKTAEIASETRNSAVVTAASAKATAAAARATEKEATATREAARAAQSQLRELERTREDSLRPILYVASAAPTPVERRFSDNQGGLRSERIGTGISVTLVNLGQGPALAVRGHARHPSVDLDPNNSAVVIRPAKETAGPHVSFVLATIRGQRIPLDRHAQLRVRVECRDLLGHGWIATVPLIVEWNQDNSNPLIVSLTPVPDAWRFEPESTLLIRQDTLAVADW